MIPNTGPFDVTGHPATSVPCGVSDGLPIGMMLVGRMGNARRSLALPTPTDGKIRAWLRREGVRIPLNVLGLPDAEVRLKLRRQPSSTTSAWPAGEKLGGEQSGLCALEVAVGSSGVII